jgi:hypothetical protein
MNGRRFGGVAKDAGPHVSNYADDLNDLRSDAAKLQAVVDAMIDEGIDADDTILSACAQVLRDSKARLRRLERGT